MLVFKRGIYTCTYTFWSEERNSRDTTEFNKTTSTWFFHMTWPFLWDIFGEIFPPIFEDRTGHLFLWEMWDVGWRLKSQHKTMGGNHQTSIKNCMIQLLPVITSSNGSLNQWKNRFLEFNLVDIKASYSRHDTCDNYPKNLKMKQIYYQRSNHLSTRLNGSPYLHIGNPIYTYILILISSNISIEKHHVCSHQNITNKHLEQRVLCLTSQLEFHKRFVGKSFVIGE